MKIRIALIALAALALAACSKEEIETGITLSIPAPAAGWNINSRAAEGESTKPSFQKDKWEVGDVLYICILYTIPNTADPDLVKVQAQYTASGWKMSNIPNAPAGATTMDIYAWYIGDAQPGEAVTKVPMMSSSTSAELTQTRIELKPFEFLTSCVIFTGLEPGDKVKFEESTANWYNLSLNTGWDGIGTHAIATVTAGEDGKVEVYPSISPNKACKFSIVTSEGEGPEQNFVALDEETWGRYYVIDCGRGE